MAKRSHEQISLGNQNRPAVGDHKRRKGDVGVKTVDEAISLLKTRSGSLVKCVEALRGPHTSNTEAELRTLCKVLLPAFQTLAGEETRPPSSSPASQDRLAPPNASSLGSTLSSEHPTTAGFSLISPTIITPWTSSDIVPSLPPLPEITDEKLRIAAFTHPAVARPGELTYDRLEWVGDANLYLLSTNLIFSTFGGFDPGKSTQLREQLVRNKTLASYFQSYNFATRARIPPHIDLNARNPSKEATKVQGDMFEAFVGAVILSDPARGTARAASWLKAVWARTLADEIRRLQKNPATQRVQELGHERELDESATAKQRLNLALRVPGVELIYEDVPTKQKNKHNGAPMFTVNLFLKGWGEQKKQLGWGTGVSKKEAGQKAAVMALANRKLMAVYEAKKKVYVEEMAKNADRSGSGAEEEAHI